MGAGREERRAAKEARKAERHAAKADRKRATAQANLSLVAAGEPATPQARGVIRTSLVVGLPSCCPVGLKRFTGCREVGIGPHRSRDAV